MLELSWFTSEIARYDNVNKGRLRLEDVNIIVDINQSWYDLITPIYFWPNVASVGAPGFSPSANVEIGGASGSVRPLYP